MRYGTSESLRTNQRVPLWNSVTVFSMLSHRFGPRSGALTSTLSETTGIPSGPQPTPNLLIIFQVHFTTCARAAMQDCCITSAPEPDPSFPNMQGVLPLALSSRFPARAPWESLPRSQIPPITYTAKPVRASNFCTSVQLLLHTCVRATD